MNEKPPQGSRKCTFLSIVVPVLNEEAVLPLLYDRLRKVMDALPSKSRVIFVDDGSTDASLATIESLGERDSRVAAISFSRNFGHQAAITAGLDFAEGDATVVMDADLQDPPELIPEMVAAYEQGCDVVYARRRGRRGEGLLKRATAHVFYRVMRLFVHRRLPVDVGDFRLMSSQVVKSLRKMREQHRFMRGLVVWVGFRETEVLFDRAPRGAGENRYGPLKMCRFAWGAITSFSALPIRAGLYVGAFLLAFCVLYGLRTLYVKFYLGTAVPGWTTLVLLQLGFSGIILLYLGLLGDYVGRLYEEAKGRPIYIIQKRLQMHSRRSRPDRAASPGADEK